MNIDTNIPAQLGAFPFIIVSFLTAKPFFLRSRSAFRLVVVSLWRRRFLLHQDKAIVVDYILEGGFVSWSQKRLRSLQPLSYFEILRKATDNRSINTSFIVKWHRSRNQIHVIARNWDLKWDKHRIFLLKGGSRLVALSAFYRHFGAIEINQEQLLCFSLVSCRNTWQVKV